MSAWVQINAAGVITRMSRTSRTDDEAPPGMVAGPDVARPSDWYWDGSAWQPRPEAPAPVITPLTPGAQVTWAVAGSAEVMDAATGVVFGTVTDVDGVITFSLPDPGSYRLDLLPSGPDLPGSHQIEVAA